MPYLPFDRMGGAFIYFDKHEKTHEYSYLEIKEGLQDPFCDDVLSSPEIPFNDAFGQE